MKWVLLLGMVFLTGCAALDIAHVAANLVYEVVKEIER
jgi:hypothetical protein